MIYFTKMRIYSVYLKACMWYKATAAYDIMIITLLPLIMGFGILYNRSYCKSYVTDKKIRRVNQNVIT